MAVVKTLLGIVILAAILVFGYWLYASYTMSTSDNRIWAEINAKLPDPLREWSCGELSGRLKASDMPQTCEDFWDSATPPEPIPLTNFGTDRPVQPAARVESREETPPVENAPLSKEGIPSNN